MERIAKFELVSFNQFKKDMAKFEFSEEELKKIYDNIKLPARATKYSAGYDFFLPFDINLKANESIAIPSGIRAKIDPSWVLQIYPRSGLGFKYQLSLANTVGIIDADYYNGENEGHIIIKLVNRSVDKLDINLESGKGFAQGIFMQYGITEDDDTNDERIGGFGSTKK